MDTGDYLMKMIYGMMIAFAVFGVLGFIFSEISYNKRVPEEEIEAARKLAAEKEAKEQAAKEEAEKKAEEKEKREKEQ